MMPIKEPKYDQNIKRLIAKMSEDCTSQNNNAKLTGCAENINYLNSRNASGDNIDDLNLSYDHMYASNTEGGELDPTDPNCQTAESEVRFLREWLLMHLELIQQQNDEILNKEKTIFLLKQENEMLKERINCLDRGISFPPNNINKHHVRDTSEVAKKDTAQELECGQVKDEAGSCDFKASFLDNCSSATDCRVNHDEVPCNQNVPENVTSGSHEDAPISCDNKDSEVHVNNEVRNNVKHESPENRFSPDFSSNSILNVSNSNFIVNSSMEDTLKHIKMSIRRKRLCSNSSALSNNDTSADERRRIRKKRKRKGSLKTEKIVTSPEQYITLSGETPISATIDTEPINMPTTNLEVPRWRVKVYTSCYSMEGTENLDDEVYNKRHMRLENDERRRKRWDVQRIREQRIVEKLKQRQEKIGAKLDDQQDPEQSLWPTLDDVKFLEVVDQLPVSAFGAPIPRFLPSEFTLPWLKNPQTTAPVRKSNSRKSTIRRKATKR